MRTDDPEQEILPPEKPAPAEKGEIAVVDPTNVVRLEQYTLFPGMSPGLRAEAMVEHAKVFVGLARDRDREAKKNRRPPLIVNIKGHEHLTIGLWQTLAALLPRPITALIEWTRPIPNGYEARAIVRTLDGVVVGSAEHQCTRDEGFWKEKADGEIRSMAQTRAQSKALASVLRFLVVLSGFSGTPYEEMPKGKPNKDTPPAVTDTQADKKKNEEYRRKTGIGKIHELVKARGIPDSDYRELLIDEFGVDIFTLCDTCGEYPRMHGSDHHYDKGQQVKPTSAILSVGELERLWRRLDRLAKR